MSDCFARSKEAPDHINPGAPKAGTGLLYQFGVKAGIFPGALRDIELLSLFERVLVAWSAGAWSAGARRRESSESRFSVAGRPSWLHERACPERRPALGPELVASF